jgi:ataxin-3
MQDSDMMCAVHALNSLIQYPLWDAVTLGKIGRDLDIEESHLTNTEITNLNVREDGFFSLQTISRALEAVSLTIEYFNKSSDPCIESAFICNYQLHWISLRKIEGLWFDLNSLGEGPEIISEFRLSAWISELSYKGFSIFTVRGAFPDYGSYPQLSPVQMRMTVDQVRSIKHKKDRYSYNEQEELLKAIEISKCSAPGYSLGSFEDDLQQAIQISRGKDPVEKIMQEEEDPEKMLQQAIAMSLDPENMSEEDMLKLAIEMSHNP